MGSSALVQALQSSAVDGQGRRDASERRYQRTAAGMPSMHTKASGVRNDSVQSSERDEVLRTALSSRWDCGCASPSSAEARSDEETLVRVVQVVQVVHGRNARNAKLCPVKQQMTS